MPLEIEGDEAEPGGLDRRRDCLRDVGLDGTGEVGPRQLETGDVVVLACASARIDALPRPTSSSGLRTPASRAA